MKATLRIYAKGTGIRLKIERLDLPELSNMGCLHFVCEAVEVYTQPTAIEFWANPVANDGVFDLLKQFTGDDIGGSCSEIHAGFMRLSTPPNDMQVTLNFTQTPTRSLRRELSALISA